MRDAALSIMNEPLVPLPARSPAVPRTLLCCAALAAVALSARAEQTMTSTETVIRLAVQPMPAPKPALRYLLLPELKEMTPGNPIPNYLTGLLDQDFAADQENFGRSALRQADRAARMDKPDWQILLRMRTDGIGLLLPDVQKMRALAAGLQARFRGEVALRRFDDALVTAKTMFAMSRHMSEQPTLISDLVGIAIAYIAVGPLEEMLEQPGCPNLYWALTNLPTPLISLDKGLEGERMLIGAELKDLDDAAPMTPEQIKKVVTHIDKILEFDKSRPENGTRAWLDRRGRDPKHLGAARTRLAESGYPEERLARFPADQVILLDEKREYEVRRDDLMKAMKLPYWELEVATAKATLPLEPKSPSTSLFDGFVPALTKVRQAQGRLEQRIALLRHVEALRLYAADHDGKLPEKLADVGVPLPVDPFTGKPFRYALEGATAHLRGTPPRGREMDPALNLHYEITIRK
jgi:hypothetical protein